jgi:hypothetical protein
MAIAIGIAWFLLIITYVPISQCACRGSSSW